jgi:hypothetical protein
LDSYNLAEKNLKTYFKFFTAKQTLTAKITPTRAAINVAAMIAPPTEATTATKIVVS